MIPERVFRLQFAEEGKEWRWPVQERASSEAEGRKSSSVPTPQAAPASKPAPTKPAVANAAPFKGTPTAKVRKSPSAPSPQ